MLNRLCKKCGVKLSSASNYFCNSCGEKLPPELILKPKISGQKVVPYDINHSENFLTRCFSKRSKCKLPKSRCWIPLLILLIFGVYLLFSKYSYLLKRNVPETTNIAICDSDFACGDYGSDNITSVIPGTASIYIEGFDFNKFSQLFLYIYPSYSDLFGELFKLNPSHFAIFAEHIGGITYWTLVIPSNVEPSSDLISMINNPTNVYIGRIEGFYIISTRNTIMGDMQTALGGIIKNISQNPVYSIAKNKSNTGSLLLLTTNNDGKNILNELLNSSGIQGYFKNIVKQFMDSGENYLTI